MLISQLEVPALACNTKDKCAHEGIGLQTSCADPREVMTLMTIYYFLFIFLFRMASKMDLMGVFFSFYFFSFFLLKPNQLIEKSSLFRICHWLFENRKMGIERDITLQF